MSTSRPEPPQQRLPLLPVRIRRVIGGHGEELIGTTVYCRLHETSVAVTECEACDHFHALHFDAATRTTSVACHCEPEPPGPSAEAAHRDAHRGPVDPETPLSDIMTKTVICVGPETPLDDVLNLLMLHSISGVPVVDSQGHAVGFVSRADLLRAAQERGDTAEMRVVTARPRDSDPLGVEPGSHVYEPVSVTAGEVMSPVVLALHESSNIAQGAAIMAFEGVHRLPILGDHGEVVGIVSALDILRWLGRRSGYLIPSPHHHA
jgi:CBS domain-containing protein